MKCGVAIADLFTGLYSTVGILAALAARETTGEGQHVDMALLDCQVAVLANQALNYLASDAAPVRLGNAHPNIVPYQAFPTKDGHLILAVGNDRQFRAFCDVAGLEGVGEDERFATNRVRVANREVLVAIVAAALRARTTQEWIAALEGVSVPCGPISTIDQVFANPQVMARGLQMELTRPDGDVTPSVANPIRLSGTPIESRRAAPILGADTRDVLARVAGLSEEEIARLETAGIVASWGKTDG